MRSKRKEKINNLIHERIFKAWIIKVKVPGEYVPWYYKVINVYYCSCSCWGFQRLELWPCYFDNNRSPSRLFYAGH